MLVSVLVVLGRGEDAVGLAGRVRAATRDSARAAEMGFMLARALHNLARRKEARAVLDDALRDPGVDPFWTVRLRALQAVVAAASGDLHQETPARQALAEAERVGDRYAAGLAAQAIGISLYYQGDVSGALEATERVLPMLGDDPRTAELRLHIQENRAAMLSNLDRLADADAAVRELVTAAERYASPHRLATIRCGAASHFCEAGRWDEALAELETLAAGSVTVPPSRQLVMHGVWALIATHRDEEATAEAHLAAVGDQPDPAVAHFVQYVVMARAALAERRGHPEQALAVLADALRPGDQQVLGERRLWLPDLTRLAVTGGDLDTARAAVATAAADAAAGATPSRTAAAGHCRGLLDGDPAPVLAAAETYRAIGRPFDLAKALEDAAVLLAERGDLPAARAAYAEAVEHYTGRPVTELSAVVHEALAAGVPPTITTGSGGGTRRSPNWRPSPRAVTRFRRLGS